MTSGIKCPKCGSSKVAKILYGLPAFDDELEAKIDAGEVVLAGCCIPYGAPLLSHECRDCGFQFDAEAACEIDITVADITEMNADAIVNSANEGLRAGGGVCGAIFRAAGRDDLQRACDEIGRCDTGDAVITPGFALDARYVIHAVGPVWSGGRSGEAELLASCYKRSLDVAAENGCRSIAFPLISSGIYGYPMEEAWRVALTACSDWLKEHGAQDIAITFCVLSEESKTLGEKTLSEIGSPGFD